MASGGARARSGPAPDPLSRTTLKNGREFLTLPLQHSVVAPEFPLPVLNQYYEYWEDKQKVREFDKAATEALRDAELEMWTRLWRKPQALMWARLDLADQVAAYVRVYLEATGEHSNAGLKTATLRMETELGISTSGLLQNGWTIEAPDVAKTAATPAKRGVKRRTTSGTWLEGVKVEST